MASARMPIASTTQRLKISLKTPSTTFTAPSPSSSPRRRARGRSGRATGWNVERDLHATVPGPALRRVVRRDRLGLAAAVGAQPLGRDAGGQDARDRFGARFRELPVRRKAERSDRHVVGMADDVDRPGHASERIADAGQEPLILRADCGLAGLEQSVAQNRHHAPVEMVVDPDEPAPDLVLQEGRQSWRGRRPGRDGRRDAQARDLGREPVRAASQIPVEGDVDPDQRHGGDGPDHPERQPTESPLGHVAEAAPAGREIALVLAALLADDLEQTLADRLELAVAAVDDPEPPLEAELET